MTQRVSWVRRWRALEIRFSLVLSVPLFIGCGGKTELYVDSGAAARGDGSGGSGAAPEPVKTSKVDLLFVVDNSAYMGDKETLLAWAAATLLDRLVHPPCVDAQGRIVEQSSPPEDSCPKGSTRASAPVRDMHVGVITSSLGDYGADAICSAAQSNDRARLIPFVRDIEVADQGRGFLTWQPDEAGFQAIDSIDALVNDTQTMIRAAGENGCGYEAPLEALYRFLVDPFPPRDVLQVDGETVRVGTDTELLDQRKDFLRPDSALAIVLVSDDNDCSVRASGDAWRLGQARMPVGTSACSGDPYDKCCVNCTIGDNPDGCPSREDDPVCAADQGDGQARIRCWDQKRRFGIDFLYPVTRYIAALLDESICPDSSAGDGDCECRHARELGEACDPGQPVQNPIYDDLSGDDGKVRSSSLVFLLGVLGVPWQDIATAESVADGVELRYRLGTQVDWDLSLGDSSARTPPEDVLMIESDEPREGPVHPITGIGPQRPDSPRDANPINGHEWNVMVTKDLQYSCLFDIVPLLGAPRDCAEVGENCECSRPPELKKAMCQDESNSFGELQYAAAARPPVRELEVVRGVGEIGLVGSVCPKQVEGSGTDAGYGYNPAMLRLFESLAAVLE